MAPGILYTYPENFRAYKALIAAQFSGAQIKIAEDFVFGETNKTEAFLKKFPLGKIPAFETSDGKYLTESNAIAYHVSNDQLKGKSDLEKAQVIQWLGFADSEILPASCAWVFPLLGIMPFNKKTVDNAKEDVAKVLTFLNTHLVSRTYLVGERITLADISVAMTMLHLFQHVLDEKARKTYQNVTRWFKTIINQPQSIAVIGQFKLADAVLEFDPKKFAQEKPKKAAAKAPAEKKEAKAKKVEEKEDDDVDMERAPAPSKDPWEALPKGKFDFDDFKRFYSNQDVDKSIPYFWDKFDPETHSIWYCEYKYNDELTKTFMSCNLIGGMYQRIEKMRKAAFASMCLFGGDNDSTISGVWVWRGHDLAFTLSPDWQIDYETYSWKKLDPKDAETKRLVELYFSWVGTDKDGRKFTEGKIFK